jgi:hypothetical protein
MAEYLSVCKICGANISGYGSCKEVYHELSLYTLQHNDKEFIHQYIVDAYAASHASENPKPITNAFALIGLYLFVEKNYSGRDVQLMHMRLGKHKRIWPACAGWPEFSPPNEKAALTVRDVLNSKPGKDRDEMIKKWAKSVWEIWKSEQKKIADLLKE